MDATSLSIRFTPDEPCQECGHRTFTGAWYVANGCRTLLEGYCTNPRCNPSVAVPPVTGFGRAPLATLVEPFISAWGTCLHCGIPGRSFSVRRGKQLVASQCLVCLALRLPPLEGDEPDTVRPPVLAATET